SQFKDALREGKFQRVALANEWVKGYLTDNTVAAPPADGRKTFRAEPAALPWMAARVAGDDELVRLLEAKKVQYEAVPQSGISDAIWVWLVPVGIAVLFWSFMMRRMAGNLGQ